MERWQLRGLVKEVDISKVITILNHIQVTVVGAYLSDVDVLATAGVVANEKIWSEIIKINS